MLLITHSGRFHADDVLAAGILQTLFPSAQLLRSREATPQPDAILFDVGRVHDPALGLFDHHQTPTPTRPNGTPYSSFGLIWAHYGQAWLDHHGLTSPGLWAKLDNGFVSAIDRMDNGQPATPNGTAHPLALPKLIGGLNPPFDAPDPDAFARAVALALPLLEGQARSIDADLRGEALVVQAVANRVDPRWIELPGGMPWLNGLRKSNATDVLYTLFPGDSGWTIAAVHQGNKDRALRKPLPAAWAGLNAADLAQATGVPDAVFCHTGRFLCVAGSRDGALALLALALDA